MRNIRHDPGRNRAAEQQELADRLPAHLREQVADGTMALSTALKLADGEQVADLTSGSALYRRLALLERIADRHAISVNYRVLALTADSIRAAAPFGMMRCPLDLGLTGEICVDATKFLGVLRTVADAEFTATVRGGALHWRCGPAKGHLPLIEATVATPQFDAEMTGFGRSFGKGLTLGGLGCGHSAFLRNAGLESVQLVNRGGKPYALASDSLMLSSCRLGDQPLPLAAGRAVTLKPAAAALLAEVTERAAQDADPEMWLGIDNVSLYCVAGDIELQLYQLLTANRYNLADKLRPYGTQLTTMPLHRESVAGFLRRVDYHAEDRRQAVVTVAVKDGRTVLSFAEAVGATEEHYDVTDAPAISVSPIRIEARRLARALDHADQLVFDYAAQNMLMLRGPNEFVFAIGGRTAE